MFPLASCARAVAALLAVATFALLPLQAHSSPPLSPPSSPSPIARHGASTPPQWNHNSALKHIASAEDALILTHMLPPLVDTFFDDAFKRLDDVSHGVLTDLTGPDLTFALSPNRSQLTARVLLPTHGRKLRMSLVARRHLQLRVHTQSESITAMAVHTLLLPVAVSADGVSISAHQDGTVHVVFKTVNESSASDHSIKPPVPSSATADHNSTNNAIRSSNMQRDVPQGDAVKRCAQEHRSCTIRFDACVCGAMDEEQGAIQCAAHVIQRCVQLLRRHRSDDEATGVKHAMMECTLSGGDVAACVERVMRACVHAVTRRGTNHSGCAMETTIHVGGGALSNGAEFVANMETNQVGHQKKEKQKKIKMTIAELFEESQRVEEQILLGEKEIDRKNEEAFFMAQDDRELASLKLKQNQELKDFKKLQEQKIQDVAKRNAAKVFQRQQQRDLKTLYKKTHEQDIAYKKTEEVRHSLAEHRERCDALIDHMEQRHIKQIKQFTNAEERKIVDQRLLVELQVTGQSAEEKAEAMKEYQSRINHQKNLDKKKLDQIREQQRMELRHFKDKMDSETRMMEEFSSLHAKHAMEETKLIQKHKQIYVEEKERILATHQQIKLMEMHVENSFELNKMEATHRIQLRQMLRAQRNRKLKRARNWTTILGRDLTASKKNASGQGSSHGSSHHSSRASGASSIQSTSVPHSAVITRSGSQENVNKKKEDKPPQPEEPLANQIGKDENEDNDDLALLNSSQLADHQIKAKEQLAEMQAGLKQLFKDQETELFDLRAKHGEEKKAKEEEFQKAQMELEWQQDIEIKDMIKANEAEIAEAVAFQERELEMEGYIRGAETKALVERKVLNSLLDSVVDAVISIDPRGFIKRFNASAEKMFGYEAKEIVEQNVKSLMAKDHADNHDDYLYNYLSTGIKKVIGTGRSLIAVKKNGQEFPVFLSVSEVVEDGFHLFTAIMRDLTEEVAKEKLRKAESDCLPQMIWKIDLKGNSLSLNDRFKNFTGLQEGNVFDPAVVHPQDVERSVADFEEANKTKQPFETKQRLLGANGQYKWFLTRGSPLFDAKGENIIAWCGSCTDIDEAEKLQAELEVLPESLPQLLWKINLDGDVLYSNTNFLNYIGAKKGDNLNVFSPKVIHPEDCEKSKGIFDHAVKYKRQFETKRRLKGTNGQYKWFLTRGAPFFDEDGVLTCYYGTCTDINESMIAQAEMIALPEALPQCVWKVDTKGNVKYANCKFKKFIGAKEGDKLNVFSEQVVHPFDLDASLEAFTSASKEKRAFEVKRRLKSHTGEYEEFMTRGTPILDDSNEIVGWYGTCTKC